MARKALVIGSVTDVNGVEWDVREQRATPYGWYVYIGWPKGEIRGRGGRGVATIPTQCLVEYISNTRLKDMDLPIGSHAIKRLRSEHGITWDWDAWWQDRGADLTSLTLEAFCKRHGCSMGAASQRRKWISEGRGMQDYTENQLGEPVIRPLHGRIKGMYSLVVVQPGSGDHVTLLEPCDWDHGRAKTHALVRNGVDPFDIRFVHRKSDQFETDGLPLRHASEALWWTHRDQIEFEKEQAERNG